MKRHICGSVNLKRGAAQRGGHALVASSTKHRVRRINAWRKWDLIFEAPAGEAHPRIKGMAKAGKEVRLNDTVRRRADILMRVERKRNRKGGAAIRMRRDQWRMDDNRSRTDCKEPVGRRLEFPVLRLVSLLGRERSLFRIGDFPVFRGREIIASSLILRSELGCSRPKSFKTRRIPC